MLPTLSTTFERVLLPQLSRRLLQYIPEEQFGFVPNTGTADVGIAIADQIATTLEARDELRVVALDLGEHSTEYGGEDCWHICGRWVLEVEPSSLSAVIYLSDFSWL